MIYLDYAAATPLDKEVFGTIKDILLTQYTNPSSFYTFAQKSRQLVEKSRNTVAERLNCSSKEIVFTSGGTESNNLALFGITESFPSPSHIITSMFEHSSVLKPLRKIKNTHQVSYIKIDKNGIINLEDLENSIREDTALISIMYVNNEIGTIQPIQKISKILKKINATRERKILFHTDACQAVNHLSIDVEELGVDVMTLSGAKIYGPKGSGILYIKAGTHLLPQILGGGQEFGFRSGTENLAAIVGFAEALKIATRDQVENNKHTKALQTLLIESIQKDIPGSHLSGSRENRIQGNVHFCFEGIEGEELLLELDRDGVCASMGSACSAGSIEPSHVLTSIGIPESLARGGLRITFGKYTTEAEIQIFLKILSDKVQKIRKNSAFYK